MIKLLLILPLWFALLWMYSSTRRGPRDRYPPHLTPSQRRQLLRRRRRL